MDIPADVPSTVNFMVDPTALPGTFGAKADYVDMGADINDPGRFHDKEVMECEWRALWTKVWQIAGRASDIKKVGDYFRYDVGRESVIVVRSDTETISAFYNACQHRGNQLAYEEFGSAKNIRCKFHTWTWDLNGNILSVSDRKTFRPAVLCGDLNLPRIRCEVWAGFVFINFNPDAEPLTEFLGIAGTQLETYRFEEMALVRDTMIELKCNWKIAMDAFQEAYHAHGIHPEALPFHDDCNIQWDILPNGHNRGIVRFGIKSPRLPASREVSAEQRFMMADAGVDLSAFHGTADDVRDEIIAAKRRADNKYQFDYSGFTDSQLADDYNYSLFPNITMNTHPEGVMVMRFLPHPSDPERCLYNVIILFRPSPNKSARPPFYFGLHDDDDVSGDTRPARRWATAADADLGPIVDQDMEAMEKMQKGIRSRGFKGARYSEQELRLRQFYREIDRLVRNERDRAPVV